MSVLLFFRYKSECVIDASPEVVFQYCDPKPDGPRTKFDRALKGLEIVESIQAASPVRAACFPGCGATVTALLFTLPAARWRIIKSVRAAIRLSC